VQQILLIDDEEKLRSLMAKIIGFEGFHVMQSESLKSADKKLMQQEVDVIICDVKLPDGNGVDFIPRIKELQPNAEVILLTAYGNIPDSVQAIKKGAFDYITKGDDNNKILPLIHRALEKVELARRVKQLEERVGKKYSFDSILGDSKAILQVVDLAKKVAVTDTTVLLLGETGTGKEVFAQAIHQASERNKKNFVAINCSAFGRELLESELFGHKAGAFTGALKDKKGLFEEANGGTIFLDEIGEMATELQAKLLRVLESGEFIKVGDTITTKVNVRVIAATNRDLDVEITENRFRSDLYYRLSVFQISLPPLRDRKSDIPILAKNFAGVFAVKTNKKIQKLSVPYIIALEKHYWKGNIRELKNVIERSVILSNDDTLDISSLPYEIQTASYPDDELLSTFSMWSIEKKHIQYILNYTKGNKTEAARLLELGLATLYRKIEEYKIKT